MVAKFELKSWGLFGEEDPLSRWSKSARWPEKRAGPVVPEVGPVLPLKTLKNRSKTAIRR